MVDVNHMSVYEAVRKVPQTAQKAFNNGRFSGTDINPMWRIKTLTEQFGMCGVGWYFDVISERAEKLTDDTVMAIVDIVLYVKADGEWSRGIYGTGGNLLVSKGKPSDEGYKMALTDALSVACKHLGIGADVYWDKDKTKYTQAEKPQEKQQEKQQPQAAETEMKPATTYQKRQLTNLATDRQYVALTKRFGVDLERLSFDAAAKYLEAFAKAEEEGA